MRSLLRRFSVPHCVAACSAKSGARPYPGDRWGCDGGGCSLSARVWGRRAVRRAFTGDKGGGPVVNSSCGTHWVMVAAFENRTANCLVTCGAGANVSCRTGI